ncbi:OB-fold nucleic acid binding domain-containing protein [Pontiella sulfatireligans]|uniref:OB domain-containing protein n=1 Tax=Pontiella sulfatireligans TaxID=2750658 RepID=A0A6C2URS3_9BACT|nr:OB-fold nucleic acid binding domain-containing protein [Pontiella sulfatireligans]VGO22839.1 hypothetical protein SCARR_04936 [Pontiella sulfatireligans]
MAGQAPENRQVECPHCGRLTGAEPRCPHCGVRLKKRKGVRWFCIAAATTGFLVLLALCSVRREPPLVRIGEIRPIMNFSTVRIQGVLESDARRMGGGEVLYVVGDGTGSLAVFVSDPGDERLPRAGNSVAASGSLSIGSGGEVRMRARSVEAQAADGGSGLVLFHAGMKGERATVTGRVARVFAPRAGTKAPFKIVLEDAGGTLDVVHWLENAPDVKAGDELEVRGTVNIYKGAVELKVWSAEDIMKRAGGALL